MVAGEEVGLDLIVGQRCAFAQSTPGFGCSTIYCKRGIL